MGQIMIELEGDELSMLEDLAYKTELSTNDYVTNVLISFLGQQIRGAYKSHAEKMTLPTLKKTIGKYDLIPGLIKEDLKQGEEPKK